MSFELVDCRFDGGATDQVFELLGVEIGDTDVKDFAGHEELFHGVPCLEDTLSALKIWFQWVY